MLSAADVASNGQTKEYRREAFRRSDYVRTLWQRVADFYALTPTLGVGFFLGTKTFLCGLWILRSFPMYATSPAWSWFSSLGIPEGALGAAMTLAGGGMAWSCAAVTAERWPAVKLASAAGLLGVWSFLATAFALLPSGTETLWIPIAGVNSVTALWVLTRTGLRPRPHHPPPVLVPTPEGADAGAHLGRSNPSGPTRLP